MESPPKYDVSRGLTSLIIGDPHFKVKNITEGLDFVEKTVNVAKSKMPTFIVVLGDILDTHERVHVDAHKLACQFFEQLSQIAPTYILIGNHDLINHMQFLTDNHIFTPLRKWDNVFIADTMPLVLEIDDATGVERTFVFCPYTPPGRFVDALDKLTHEGYNWDLADCIFAHQEFEGCKMDKLTSADGDKWDEAYPCVISGHIHDAQTVGTNVFYTGSAIQQSFGDSSAKRIWFVNWEDNGETYEDQPFSVEKINLGMKSKILQSLTMDELMAMEDDVGFMNLVKRCTVKIKITGASSEFKQFRRSRFFATLKKIGVVFAYTMIEETMDESELANATRKDVSFHEVFRDVVSKKDDIIRDEYSIVFGVVRPEDVPEDVPEDFDAYSESDQSKPEIVFGYSSD